MTETYKKPRELRCGAVQGRSKAKRSLRALKYYNARKTELQEVDLRRASSKCCQQSQNLEINVLIHPLIAARCLIESLHSSVDISVGAILVSARQRGGAKVLICLNNNFHTNAGIQSASASRWQRQNNFLLPLFFFLIDSMNLSTPWWRRWVQEVTASRRVALQFPGRLLSVFGLAGKYPPSGFPVTLLAEMYSSALSQLSRAGGEPQILRGTLHFRRKFTHFLGAYTKVENTELLKNNNLVLSFDGLISAPCGRN